MIKENLRPFSHFGRANRNQPNRTFSEEISKQIKLKLHNHPKKYYININNRKINNSFTKLLQQKKLFLHKIYNRNNGRSDELGLSAFLQVQNEKGTTNINTLIRTKDFSSTRLSSSYTYQKINLKSKINHRGQKQDLEEHKSFENTFFNDNKIYSNNISKQDKISEVKNDELNIIDNIKKNNYNKNNDNNKNKHISVSALFDKQQQQQQFNEEKIDIKCDDLNPDMKVKNCFIIKFGSLLNIFQKIISNGDWIRMNYRTTFENISTNLSKRFDICYNILLNKILDENCLQSFNNFCEEIINWQKMAMDEIRHLKKENIYFIKKQKLLEKELNIRKNEIKDINENIIKYDLNKVKKGKLIEKKVEKVKNNFNNIESNYILIIYQLQKEIEELKNVLGEKKDEKMNNDELKLEIKNLRRIRVKNDTLLQK